MLNKAILIGNLGKDAEIRNTNDGRAVVNFSLATTETWKDKQSGEYKNKTEWHTIVAFGDNYRSLAEKRLKKGAKVYIEGQIQTRKWQDKNGNDRYSTEIILQGYSAKIALLDKIEKEEGSYSDSDFAKSAQHYEEKSNGYQPQDDLEDECPF